MTRTFASAIIAIFVVMNAAPGLSGERIESAAYAGVNTVLVETHVRPRYARLSAATEAFVTAAQDLCASPDETGLARARARFNDIMDAWIGVQHLRFGPIELFMRADRFYFWPQARGKVTDAIGEFIAAVDQATLLPSHIGRANVAVQGLLAVEVLLYGDEPLDAKSGANAIGCGLLGATAENMRSMADGTVAGWREGELSFSQLLAEPGSKNPYFQDHREATLAFFGSLHDSLQLIADVKLKPVVGDTIQEAKPHMAESHLSGRSLRNVIEGLEALQALYGGEGGRGLGDLVRTGDPKLDQLLRKAFRLTITTARSIDRPLEEAAVDLSRRSQVEKLTMQVRALRQIVRDRLAPALGLSVGFNALDGD